MVERLTEIGIVYASSDMLGGGASSRATHGDIFDKTHLIERLEIDPHNFGLTVDHIQQGAVQDAEKIRECQSTINDPTEDPKMRRHAHKSLPLWEKDV